MALWCKNFPTAGVAFGDAAKRVTLVMPFYQNHQWLRDQAIGWWTWGRFEPYASHVKLILVDDGSPEPMLVPEKVPFETRAFRIECDVRWNWLAARNIGAHYASTEWMLLTDMDHLIPWETMDSVLYGRHDPSAVYAFTRREHTGEPLAPHSASFLMTKEMFWQIGGYDEALSGYYGTDGEYRRRVATVAPIRIWPRDLVRYEYVNDSSTTRYKRKQPEDAAVGRLVAARKPGWRPRVLSFPYREVALCPSGAV